MKAKVASGVPFVKGDKRAGRPKGCKNKINSDVKMMVDHVLNKLGGEEWLLNWVQKSAKNEAAFVQVVLNKLLPSKIDLEHDGDVKITVKVVKTGNGKDLNGKKPGPGGEGDETG